MSGMLALPEGCIAVVISFTSPRDACRLACVSTTFRSAADSDVVWDRFLPPDYLTVISDPGSVSGSSSSSTLLALSKKELHFRMCHNLIHNGNMSFWFDLQSGKKCYMISARELNIGGNPREWIWLSTDEGHEARSWLPRTDCRFSEVVRFTGLGNGFELSGKINTSHLSPMTTYVAYLVFAEHRFYHTGNVPIKSTVGLVGSNNVQNRTFYFPWNFPREQQDGDDDDCLPKKRADGWLESELGEFFNRGDEDNELLMTISECEEGLLIQGIEIRPKKE